MNEWIVRHRAHMEGAGRSERNITDRVKVLTRLDRELPLGLLEATVEELEDWLAKPCWSNQTKATYYGHIVGFYRWAADPRRNRHLSYDPSVSLTRARVPRTVPRPVTDDELTLVLDRAQGRYRVYCLLAAYAGLRCISIADLRREDITEEAVAVRGKGGKRTLIPTHPEIWRSVRDFPAGPVALRASGLPATAKDVSIYTSEHLNRVLGPNKITLHRLRHWFATALLRQGVNLRVVQELLMHASLETTAIYTEVTGEERRLAVGTLPALAPPTI